MLGFILSFIVTEILFSQGFMIANHQCICLGNTSSSRRVRGPVTYLLNGMKQINNDLSTINDFCIMCIVLPVNSYD